MTYLKFVMSQIQLTDIVKLILRFCSIFLNFAHSISYIEIQIGSLVYVFHFRNREVGVTKTTVDIIHEICDAYFTV